MTSSIMRLAAMPPSPPLRRSIGGPNRVGPRRKRPPPWPWCTRARATRAKLCELWETLLFNQFHDILTGTSIPSATTDALQALGGVVQGADVILNGAIRRLAATVTPAPEPTDASFLVI